ncbi:MAG: response regulator [Flavobacterium sp.]|nr:MAG: response regulator [Flavobacterium sp.]
MRKIPGLDCILLIEDDRATNFIHTLAIEELKLDARIEVCLNGREGLDYLTCRGKYSDNPHFPQPGLIFLDINMPLMDGWEFLMEYEKLSDEQKGNIILMMVSASTNPDDEHRAMHQGIVNGYINKPLTAEIVSEIIEEHYASPEA